MKIWVCGGILLALSAGCVAGGTSASGEPGRATRGDASPTIPAPRSEAESRTIRLELTAPEGGWTLRIVEFRRDDRGLVGYARLTPPVGLAAQVLTEIAAEVDASLPEMPVRWVVVGKTWRWGQDEGVDHVKETDPAWRERGKLPLVWRGDEQPEKPAESRGH